MTQHACVTLTDGCYRCDLNRDEMEAIASDCMVTRAGVVHYDDCRFVSGPCSTAVRWVLERRQASDRPCSHCMPAGLPAPAPGSTE